MNFFNIGYKIRKKDSIVKHVFPRSKKQIRFFLRDQKIAIFLSGTNLSKLSHFTGQHNKMIKVNVLKIFYLDVNVLFRSYYKNYKNLEFKSSDYYYN